MISVKVLYKNEIRQLIFCNLRMAKNLFDVFYYIEVDDLSKLNKDNYYYIEKNNNLTCDNFLDHTIKRLSKVDKSDRYYFNIVNFIYDTLNVSDKIYEKMLFSGEALSNNEIDYLNDLVDCYYEKNKNDIYSINFENIDISNYIDTVFFTINYIHFIFVSNGLRIGQSFFNALTYALPIIADKIRGDQSLDCYYDDKKLKNLNNLMKYLNKYKRY